MGSHRKERVAGQIQQELARLLLTEAKDPRLAAVAITTVKVTADLQIARVYYRVVDETEREAVANGLERATGFLRTALGQRLRLRRTPELSFEYDESLERGNRMEALLAELKAAGEMGGSDEDDVNDEDVEARH